ncbi:hypothetical protein [Streptomyces sp. NEAU-S7GS2]|uniref:hypothetical protein n=1 Tax=Streptomyces sp. NEAU-S7GS2 TaxID=2202000 RepID=UPI000D6EE066|nr:hypothetical protein [Streptomyces sp. NEAU-S7GS2]AWN24806.1 hypothetical protein DKG71_00200 [Streptomyces sp. NEAU-S7GS2]
MATESQASTTVQFRVSDATFAERRSASVELETALRAAGMLPYATWIGRSNGDPAVMVHFSVNSAPPLVHGDVGQLPAPDVASALQRELSAHGIEAHVTALDRIWLALRIAVDSARDTRRLAALVMRNLTEQHAAAHRLRTALIGADIKANEVCTEGNEVSIGDITATDAVTLVEILEGNGDVSGLDLGNWRGLEILANRLCEHLTEIAGGVVSVFANPACSSCSSTRDDEVTLGATTPERARRLANAIEQANGPHRHLVQRPLSDNESALPRFTDRYFEEA